MSDEEFYLLDLKSKFDKIKPNTYYLSYSGGKDSHFLYWFIKEYLKRDDIKNRLDDILCDFEKQVRNISITIKVGVGEVSVLNIVKEVAVQGVDKE